jgi:dCTP deaminase
LTDGSIRELLKRGALSIWVPSDRERVWGKMEDVQFQPVSVDLRLSDEILYHPSGAQVALGEFHGVWLEPGQCVLGSTVERIQLPNDLVGVVRGKSSIAREFVSVEAAGLIDPGFRGDITLEIKNNSSREYLLRPGKAICHITFDLLEAEALRPYGHPKLKSKYLGQSGPTPSRGF